MAESSDRRIRSAVIRPALKKRLAELDPDGSSRYNRQRRRRLRRDARGCWEV